MDGRIMTVRQWPLMKRVPLPFNLRHLLWPLQYRHVVNSRCSITNVAFVGEFIASVVQGVGTGTLVDL